MTRQQLEGWLSLLFFASVIALVEILFQAAGSSLTSAVPKIVAAYNRPPPEPSTQVVSLLARLKELPVLERLENTPLECGRSKHERNGYCRFPAGDIVVSIGWSQRSGKIASMNLRKQEPKHAAPFAWVGLPMVLSRLCDVEPNRAATISAEALEAHGHMPWRASRDQPMAAPHTEGTARYSSLSQGDKCELLLHERIDRGRVRARLSILGLG